MTTTWEYQEVVRIIHRADGLMKRHINIQSIRTDGIVLKKRLDNSWTECNRIPRGMSFRKYIENCSPDECDVKKPEMLDCVPR